LKQAPAVIMNFRLFASGKKAKIPRL